MHHGFINWIGGFIWEDASGETRNDFLDFVFMSQTQDIVVDCHIDSKEFKVSLHVAIQATDFGGQVNNVGGLIFFENLSG